MEEISTPSRKRAFLSPPMNLKQAFRGLSWRFKSSLNEPHTLHPLIKAKGNVPLKPGNGTGIRALITNISSGMVSFLNANKFALSAYFNSSSSPPISSRRDILTLVHLKTDWMRLVPVLPLVLLPGTVIVLPAILGFVPSLLPYFLENGFGSFKRDALIKSRLKYNMEILDEIKGLMDERASKALDGKMDWIYTPLSHSLSLCNLPNDLAKKLCRYLGMPFPGFWSKARLLRWIDWTLKDSQLLKEARINSLSVEEVGGALLERGFILKPGTSHSKQLQMLEEYQSLIFRLCSRKLSKGSSSLSGMELVGPADKVFEIGIIMLLATLNYKNK